MLNKVKMTVYSLCTNTNVSAQSYVPTTKKDPKRKPKTPKQLL